MEKDFDLKATEIAASNYKIAIIADVEWLN